jgi:LytS/YehU family sensor histidine kinase
LPFQESDIGEASKKLAECQEEMQNITKQLQAMSEQKNTTSSDQKNNFIPNLKSDQKSCSLYQILVEDSVQKGNSNENDKLEALAAEQENGADLIIKVSEKDVPIQSVPKRKKEGTGLLSRIFFGRKRGEIKPEKET